VDKVDAVDGDADSARSRNLVFELHGNQFEFRPADRANRKFKWKSMDYL
jgi:ribonuclease P protein subunit POP4